MQIKNTGVSGERLAPELDRLAERRPLPSTIVCDNGPELTSKAMVFWSQSTGVKLHFIQPGSLPRTHSLRASMASSGGYCLDLHWFASLDEARSTIHAWRDHYNLVIPHRSLNNKPPVVFAQGAA